MTRVLIADDSGTMRTILRRCLEAHGVRGAVEAADGTQAISMFQPGGFDLVLTDWNMPGKNGLEVAKEIRAQDSAVPIVMVTTESEKTRILEALQAGVNDYLIKPFTSDAVKSKLAKYTASV